jgi:fucose 4-O-acetylase-like acetyltransferase
MGILYGTGNTLVWIPLWFLPHLFISSTIALILLKAFEAKVNSKMWLAFSAALLLIIGIYFVDASWQPDATGTYIPGVKGLPGLPWSIDLAPITTSFIIFGYLLGEHTKSMVFNKNGFLVSVLVFISLRYFFDHTMDLNIRMYSDPIVSTLQAAIGIYITISVASLLQEFPSFSRPLAYLGSGSLFILIFHSAPQAKVFWRLSQISTNQYLNGLASFVAGILLSLLLWEIAKRQKHVAKLLLPSKSYSLPAAQIQTPSSTTFSEWRQSQEDTRGR